MPVDDGPSRAPGTPPFGQGGSGEPRPVPPAIDPIDELFPLRQDRSRSTTPGRLEIPSTARRRRSPAHRSRGRARSGEAATTTPSDSLASSWLDPDERSAVERHEPHATPASTTRAALATGSPGVPEAPETGSAPRTAGVVQALGVAVVAVGVRLVLATVLGAHDVRHLSDSGLVLSGLGLAVVTLLLARVGVAGVVCLAVAVALATADVAAPVGVLLVVAAVAAERHRRRL